MKFYIADDDLSIIHALEEIIEEENLGEILGSSLDGETAYNDLILMHPDIVLVDLLMPEKDGATLVQELSKELPDTHFIMISQVSTKSLIAKAYDAGIEFFISKPINRIEVLKVLQNIIEKIHMQRKFNIIETIFKTSAATGKPMAFSEIKDDHVDREIRKIKIIVSKLGIMGEKGGDDILFICQHILRKGEQNQDISVRDFCEMLSDNPKAMEQRIRRAINRGLVNIANLGIEDYMNDVFIRFSSTLYDFENVKAEMDFIRGKRRDGGKINVRKFIENLLLHKDL